MKCDLCKHRELHSKSSLLCESCAEMIQRLLVLQTRMESHDHHEAEVEAAPSNGISAWGSWQ
jgi:hypothetical protein